MKILNIIIFDQNYILYVIQRQSFYSWVICLHIEIRLCIFPLLDLLEAFVKLELPYVFDRLSLRTQR